MADLVMIEIDRSGENGPGSVAVDHCSCVDRNVAFRSFGKGRRRRQWR